MSDKRIGTKNFGKVYLKGKRYRSHREWRGIVDTLYDYSRWLYNWFNMFRIVLSKPRTSRLCSVIAGCPAIWPSP